MNIVGYVRISRDEDKENYSSIETQKDIINEYAQRNNWVVRKIYEDDNYSGFSFKRPAFMEMRRNLEDGKVDIIIAKDLSRIGRHNAKTQLFIEEVQEMGKRLILPEEGKGYDSDADDDDILGIKTWYNERYVKDISRKVKANMHSRQKKGDLIMGNLYGYYKDPNNKSVLHVDERIRPIIQQIFKLYHDGYGYKKICDALNEKSFPTPSMNIKQKHAENGRVFKNKVSEKWQTHTVKRILADDLYIGVLRTHKKQNKRIKGKQEKVAREEQYVFPNHHEPIISSEDFELAQQLNSKRREQKYKGSAKYPYIFSSFVYCGDCGYSATGKNLKRYPAILRGYECTMYSKYGLKSCVSHYLPEKKLLFYFKEFLMDIRDQYREYLNTINFQDKRKNIVETLSGLKKDLNVINEELKLLISQKLKDLIREENPCYKEIIEHSYVELENEKKARIAELSSRLEELQLIQQENLENNPINAITVFDNIIEAERPNRRDLELILDRIYIYGKEKSNYIEFKLLVNIEQLTHSEETTKIFV